MLAEVVLLLWGAAIGTGLLVPFWGMTPGKTVKGSSICFPESAAMPVTILTELKDMLEKPRGGMPHPLNRFWWVVKDCDYTDNKLVATLDYVEDVVRRRWKGSEGIVRQMTMTWRISAGPGRSSVVEIEWSGLESPDSPIPCDRIARTMQLMTEELLNKLNKTLLPTPKARGGLSAQFLAGAVPSNGRFSSAGTSAKSKVSWPSPQDFNESIQEPRIAFADPQLQKGQAELNMMGMPRVASGAFASVYKLVCPEKNWAVRCFLNPVRDQQYRYEQLTKYVNGDNLSCTVDFEYVSKGIKVGGEFFPILKMEWVEGQQLHIYIEETLKKGQSLEPLLIKFRQMMQSLFDAGIAHGDLQHGNIIVRDGEIVLVDYDCLYVPCLSMEKSNEIGHPNYQHPARGKDHFGPYLDNFSAHLIDTTLTALCVEPELWRRFDGGDECLLFRRRDLLAPQNSELFSALVQHKDSDVKFRAVHLIQQLNNNITMIPALGARGIPLTPWRQITVESAVAERGIPAWMEPD